jgi:hypothetical protein
MLSGVGGRVSTRLFADAAEHARMIARADLRAAQVARELERLRADPTADPDFVRAKSAEAERLLVERKALEAAPATPPPGPYAVAALVPVKRRIARDPAIATAMKRLDAEVGESNRAAAAAVPPPPAAPGEPRYVGIDDCELCHAAAVKLWKGTVHARAWGELTAVDKQWSYDCIGCHVTGYGKAGGSAMAHVEKLEAVQCEVCHGPGSLHVEHPRQVHLTTPSEGDCKGCHTKDHSDTFQFVPYLRDVLGPGHGAKRLAALGAGPTGHELRHGAKERARVE